MDIADSDGINKTEQQDKLVTEAETPPKTISMKKLSRRLKMRENRTSAQYTQFYT